MALFRGGPRLGGTTIASPFYQGIAQAEAQKGEAMREAMGAFGEYISPKATGMRKFKKEFAGADWNSPATYARASQFLSEYDPQAAISMASTGRQLADSLAPKRDIKLVETVNAAGEKVKVAVDMNTVPTGAMFATGETPEKDIAFIDSVDAKGNPIKIAVDKNTVAAGTTFAQPSPASVIQKTGAQLNEQLNLNLPKDETYNVDEKGRISRIGTGKEAETVQIGSIPQGWEVVKEEGTGALSMRPIAGGPVEAEQQAAVEAGEKLKQAKETASDVVNTDLDRLETLVSEEGLMSPVTGISGMVASFIPSTARSDAEALAETIKANVGFDKLQAMRDASPTGGALGQVSNQEIGYLQATLGNLKFSQSKEQLLRNIDQVRQAYNKIVHGYYEPPHLKRGGGDVLGILD